MRVSIIFLPVASPPACRILLVECPPSLVRRIFPLSSTSKGTPKSINICKFSEASYTNSLIASLSKRPDPAIKVSSICLAIISSLVFNSPAIPPCAR